jgi:hypothetical protein
MFGETVTLSRRSGDFVSDSILFGEAMRLRAPWALASSLRTGSLAGRPMVAAQRRAPSSLATNRSFSYDDSVTGSIAISDRPRSSSGNSSFRHPDQPIPPR